MSADTTTPTRPPRHELTPHEERLARLLPELIADFGESQSPDSIRSCVEDVLARYDSMPSHHYVEVVAAREAREALRRAKTG